MVAGTTGREGGADEKEGFKTGAKSLNKLWIKKTVKKDCRSLSLKLEEIPGGGEKPVGDV